MSLDLGKSDGMGGRGEESERRVKELGGGYGFGVEKDVKEERKVSAVSKWRVCFGEEYLAPAPAMGEGTEVKWRRRPGKW